MNKLLRKQLSNQRGVTLIELLAVIVILGIIAAVAVPVVLNQIDDAEKNADAATLAVIEDAAQRYFIKLIDDSTTEITVDQTVTTSTLESSGYLKPAPTGSPYPTLTATYDIDTGKVTLSD